jgi:hypothetical protein
LALRFLAFLISRHWGGHGLTAPDAPGWRDRLGGDAIPGGPFWRASDRLCVPKTLMSVVNRMGKLFSPLGAPPGLLPDQKCAQAGDEGFRGRLIFLSSAGWLRASSAQKRTCQIDAKEAHPLWPSLVHFRR